MPATTLTAIGVTLLGGSAILLLCVLAFQCALLKQSPKIAPRCTARPPETISNTWAEKNAPSHAQHRCGGNWVKWVMGLSEATLLHGVPGTGTRNGGLEGSLLHVNLDCIVLIRFHRLGRKLATFCTVLYIFVLMPLYITTPQPKHFIAAMLEVPSFSHDSAIHAGNISSADILTACAEGSPNNTSECNNSTVYKEQEQHRLQEEQQRNYYRRTTMGNVPNLYYFRHEQSQHRQNEERWFKTFTLDSTDSSVADVSETVPDDAIVFRLRAAVLVVWLVTIYAYYLLTEEWTEMVAMRRIWYLEQRKWVRDVSFAALSSPKPTKKPILGNNKEGGSGTTGIKRQALERRMSSSRIPMNMSEWYKGLSKLHRDDSSANAYQEEEPQFSDRPDDDDDDDDDDHKYLMDREAWIPHPEQPDTVPNIEPYSLLIGPLPKAARVLEASPLVNRAGKSSLMTEEDSLHSHSGLRFPQQLLLQGIVHQLEEQLPKEPGFSSPVCAISVVPTAKEIGPVWMHWYETLKKLRRLLFIRKHMRNLGYDMETEAYGDDNEVADGQGSAIMKGASDLHTAQNTSTYLYLKEVFGEYLLDEEWIGEAQKMGPEQLGVYSRELAQAAAPFCPYGCFEGQVRRASLSKLTQLHEDQKQILEDAKAGLQRIQKDFMLNSTLLDYSDIDDGDDQFNNTSNLSDVEGLSLLRPSHDDGSRIIGNGFIARKRSLAARCLFRDSRIEANDAEEEYEAVEMVTSGGPTSNRASSAVGSSRRQRQKRGLWRFLEAVDLRETQEQLRLCAAEILRQYRNPASWKRLLVRCWSKWDQEDPYVIVTFTSRQAAAAARQSLSSAGVQLNDIPIPPLADAGALRMLPCRFFCRPVTVTVNYFQKGFRLYMILAFLVLMCIFYTIPLTKAANRLDPETIAYLFPTHKQIQSTTGVSLPDLLSGLTTSIIWSLFFMLCPQVFKLFAYFGSNATSLAQAERCAHQYFWWFMVFTAFAGPMLAYWVLGAIYYRDDTLRGGLQKMLLAIAGTTPTTIAATWINWIIYRFTIILPINFLLQFNTFMFAFLGCNCCSRITIGGGPGGPTPYRLFVDSGVVLMCCVALGPASPLVAPAALLYFLVCEPLLRRNCIFVYRQRYDDGGMRWIFVFHMITSLLIVGHLLLALQMVLKTAYGCGFISAIAIPVTLYFQWSVKRKFKPSFENTALLRTNLLDGKESLDDMTIERREEHRRYLVDAHRAAYIPACLCGTECEEVLTTTPAVVIKDRHIDSTDSHNDLMMEEMAAAIAPVSISRDATNTAHAPPAASTGCLVPRKKASSDGVSNRRERKLA